MSGGDNGDGIRAVQLGEPAPLFEAQSTEGLVSLGEYRGRWVLLFARPADFTPVCTSEFVALARAKERFDALGCALVGLSVDSVYAHLAWLDRIEADYGIRPRFPLIEDQEVPRSNRGGGTSKINDLAGFLRTLILR